MTTVKAIVLIRGDWRGLGMVSVSLECQQVSTMKVSVSKHIVHGAYQWVVSRRESGKRKRSFFNSKASADAEAARIRDDMAKTGSAWTDLPAHERSRLMEAWNKAKSNGIDLMAMAVKPSATPAISKTIAEVMAELDVAKKAAGRDGGYRKILLLVLNQFAKGRQLLPIDQITLADVETFLDARSLAYRSTLRSRLSTLFNFAVRRGYMDKNPCAKLEPITYHKPPPQIFTPKQLKAALDWLKKNPRGMTWFVLTTLCGLRPEEAQKSTKAKIQIKSGIVIVDTQTTKIRERRVVTPMPEAIAWLERSLKLGGQVPLPDQFKRRLLHRLRKVLGFDKWPKDITRHTAASIWLARIKSAAEVAEQLGNSEKVLKRDYKALVTPELLAEFLKVLR